MDFRAARYRRIRQPPSPSDWTLIAHLGKTPKGKIRLYSIGITRRGEKERSVSGNLLANDPRYVFDDDYGMRKTAHEIVRKSGQFSKFYDSRIRIVYDSV